VLAGVQPSSLQDLGQRPRANIRVDDSPERCRIQWIGIPRGASLATSCTERYTVLGG
jgi:hypothetical protein